jgi:hypothetical protein
MLVLAQSGGGMHAVVTGAGKWKTDENFSKVDERTSDKLLKRMCLSHNLPVPKNVLGSDTPRARVMRYIAVNERLKNEKCCCRKPKASNNELLKLLTESNNSIDRLVYVLKCRDYDYGTNYATETAKVLHSYLLLLNNIKRQLKRRRDHMTCEHIEKISTEVRYVVSVVNMARNIVVQAHDVSLRWYERDWMVRIRCIVQCKCNCLDDDNEVEPIDPLQMRNTRIAHPGQHQPVLFPHQQLMLLGNQQPMLLLPNRQSIAPNQQSLNPTQMKPSMATFLPNSQPAFLANTIAPMPIEPSHVQIEVTKPAQDKRASFKKEKESKATIFSAVNDDDEDEDDEEENVEDNNDDSEIDTKDDKNTIECETNKYDKKSEILSVLDDTTDYSKISVDVAGEFYQSLIQKSKELLFSKSYLSLKSLLAAFVSLRPATLEKCPVEKMIKVEKEIVMKFRLSDARKIQSRLPIQCSHISMASLEEALNKFEKSSAEFTKALGADYSLWKVETPLDTRAKHVEEMKRLFKERIDVVVKVLSNPLGSLQKQLLLLGASDEGVKKFLCIFKISCAVNVQAAPPCALNPKVRWYPV